MLVAFTGNTSAFVLNIKTYDQWFSHPAKLGALHQAREKHKPRKTLLAAHMFETYPLDRHHPQACCSKGTSLDCGQ